MLKKQENYQFRKEICKMHARIQADKNDLPGDNEFPLPKIMSVSVDTDDIVAVTAVKDFIAYLKTAFGIKCLQVEKGGLINISVDETMLNECACYMGRRVIVTNDGVNIYAYDSRGVAQALYSLEDVMNDRRNSYLPIQDKEYKPQFSPRMVHSGYGVDQYPDEYLSACAHNGYDAIIVFVKDATHSAHGECDFNDIVRRAAKYGIDVYAYSYFMNFVHPLEEGAKEKYAKAYGGIFESIKGLKGMIFVGESIEFPSRDPHVVPMHHRMQPEDGIPDGRRFPGWWPCYDYADWICLVRDSIRAVSPDADVVFWTYNFGYVDKKYRLPLIEALPTDISLLVTFEMFEYVPIHKRNTMVRDYTLFFEGPGSYFISEAECAKKRGIRLYAMANTGGRTWDYGVAPYEPFPYQWNKRHKNLLDAKEKYGLAGLMESHHFGFTPSFISRLTKDTFTYNTPDFDKRMTDVARSFSLKEYDTVLNAFEYIDKAVCGCVPSVENQYGPMRIGPAYPFCLRQAFKRPNKPGVMYGNGIYKVMNYNSDYSFDMIYSLRVEDEVYMHKEAVKYFKKGIKLLESIKYKNNKLLKLINLCRFLMRCHITGANEKQFYILRQKMLAESDPEKIDKLARRIEPICRNEIKNVEATIPLVEKDSSLGYEPSMDYQCDKAALLWKLKHMNYMLDNELQAYKKPTN